MHIVQREEITLLAVCQEKADSEPEEILLDAVSENVYKQFEEAASKTETIPTIGSQILEEGDKMYVQTI